MAFIRFTRPSGEEAIVTFDVTVSEQHTGTAQVTEYAVETGSNVSDHVRPDNDRISLEIVISDTPVTDQYTYAGQRAGLHSHLDGASALPETADLLVAVTPRRPLGADPRLVNPGQPPVSVRDITRPIRLIAPIVTPAPVGGVLGAGLTVSGSFRVSDGVRPEFAPQPLQTFPEQVVKARVLRFSSEVNRVQAVFAELQSLRRTGTVCTIVTSLWTYTNMVIESVDGRRDAELGSAIRCNLDARAVRLVTTETIAVEPARTSDSKQKKRGNQPTATATDAQEKKASLAFKLLGAL